MKKKLLICLAAVFLICSVKAKAQEGKKGLSLVMAVEKEITVEKDGKTLTQLIPAEKTMKGDILVYMLKYKNEDREKLTGASFVAPIPEGTSMVEGSVAGKDTDILFSIDRGAFFRKPPVRYSIKKPDGTTVEKTAGPDMYTHIKWVLKKDLLPGESGTVIFKTKVK